MMRLLKMVCVFAWVVFSSTLIALPNIEPVESVPLETVLMHSTLPRTQAIWLKMIKQAKHSIAIASFYIDNVPGKPLATVVQALHDAVLRGVKVRLLLDEHFKKQSQASLGELKQDGILVQFMPMTRWCGGVMHAKYWVIDQRAIYLGSANLDWRSLDQIHELGLYVANTRIAKELLAVFNRDWLAASTQHKAVLFASLHSYRLAPRENLDSTAITLAESPAICMPAKGLPLEQTQWVNVLLHAQHRVLMQVLSYSPTSGYGAPRYWPVLDDAIRAAAMRGVKIKMIVSNWSLAQGKKRYLQSLAALRNVTVKYSKLPAYSKGFIPFARVEHLKYMVADDQTVWVGTGNWQGSYFTDSRDVALIVHDKSLAKQLQHIFMRDWLGPYVHTIE